MENAKAGLSSTPSNYVLEINLISAQGLKIPSNNFNYRRIQTYAVAWVDPTIKLRTRIDTIGEENPTWNDKFLFRVSSEFLSRETSGVSIEIYAVGCFSDSIIGTVRFLIGNVIGNVISFAATTPAFTAVQVRRRSGRCQGVLNIGVMVNEDSNFPSMNGISAIGYRDLMGESYRLRRRMKKSKSGDSIESCENSFPESPDLSDGSESSASSSSTASNVLKDLNGIRNMAGIQTLNGSNGKGFLCGLIMQKKSNLCPSDETFNMER